MDGLLSVLGMFDLLWVSERGGVISGPSRPSVFSAVAVDYVVVELVPTAHYSLPGTDQPVAAAVVESHQTWVGVSSGPRVVPISQAH